MLQRRLACSLFLVSVASCTGEIVNGYNEPNASPDNDSPPTATPEGSPDGGLGDDTQTGGESDVPVDAAASPPTTPDAALPLPDVPDAAPLVQPYASDVQIRDVVLYQAVAIELVRNGTEVNDRNAPVVADADALLRIFVDVNSGWDSREIVAEVLIDSGDGNVHDLSTTETVSSSSGDEPGNSAFSILIPADALTVDATYSVALREVELASQPGQPERGARFPESGVASMGVQSSNGGFELVLVPFRYQADGSGRLPPIDDDTIEDYRRQFLALYPISSVNVTVHEPVNLNESIADGDFGNWLDDVAALRNREDPPANAFYYGIAAPADSFGQYCGRSCATGLGFVPGRDGESGRAAVGVSFRGRRQIDVAMHEVGHNMGRRHAPCGGPANPDGNYPYSGGSLGGIWGYDIIEQENKDPREFRDIMGYCNPTWISDYTYSGIFARIQYINRQAAQAAQSAVASPGPFQYRVARVDGDNKITWRRFATHRRKALGKPMPMNALDETGRSMGSVMGEFFPYDHQEGGMLLVPVGGGDTPAALEAAGMQRIEW